MSIGVEVPKFYIIPTQRFKQQFGINVAEFDFPDYFYFFFNNRQVVLISDKKGQTQSRFFSETLNFVRPIRFWCDLLEYSLSQIQNDMILMWIQSIMLILRKNCQYLLKIL